jgi:cytoskeletal protein CcmA (bactofilin family)
MAFGRTKDADTGTHLSPAPAAQGGLTAFIDQGSEFEGKLSFKDTVRIDGTFTGEIQSENTLIVGESGEIHAQIRSKSVMISGAVEGDVYASRQLVLHKTARLQGNVESPSIVIEEGAIFNGQVKMTRPDQQGRKDAPKLESVTRGD